MAPMELFIWAIAGGFIVAILSTGAVLYNKEEINTKHLSRDFILGAAFTGFLYPLIPESFDDIKAALGSGISGTIKAAKEAAGSASIISPIDPGVKVGPANF